MGRRQNAMLSAMGLGYDMAPMGDWRTLASSRRVQSMGLGTVPYPPGDPRWASLPASWGHSVPQQLPPPQPVAPVEAPPRILGMTRAQLVVLALVVIVLIYIAYRLGKARTSTPMSAVRKMSTNRLSKALYERLERNGRGSERTRSALAQLGR
ncbi:MAG TPA: hypothetical protein VIY27_06735 [Myxococcota bacterium]